MDINVVNIHIYANESNTTGRTSCKILVILVTFELNLNFLDRFSKYTQTLNFMETRLVKPKYSMQVDGQT
jgi:hypothetical protein